MSKHFNVNETAAGAGNSRAMEADTISKTRASSKSQMSKRNKSFSAIFIFVALLSIVTMSASAQKAKEQKFSGDVSSLKDQKEINVVIDFTGMTVNDQPEESHIEFFTKDKNMQEKERWITEWNVEMRNDCYKKIIEGFYKNKKMKKNNLQWSFGNFANAENTIYIKVINIDTGAFLLKNTRVKADISILKTGENTPFATMPCNIYGLQSSNVATPIGQIASTFKMLGFYICFQITKKMK